MEEILEHIPSLVSQEKNKLLLKPIEMEELEEAVKQLKNDKAPGPYDFTTNLSTLVGTPLSRNFWKL